MDMALAINIWHCDCCSIYMFNQLYITNKMESTNFLSSVRFGALQRKVSPVLKVFFLFYMIRNVLWTWPSSLPV